MECAHAFESCAERVLSALSIDCSRTSREIANMLGTTKHAVNVALYGMLAKGQVVCEGDSPPRWRAPQPPQDVCEESDDEASEQRPLTPPAPYCTGTGPADSDTEEEPEGEEPMETEAASNALFGDIDLIPHSLASRMTKGNPVCGINEYCMYTHRCLFFEEYRSGGQDHVPLFECKVFVDRVFVCTGSGPSKKAARRDACANAVTVLIDNCGVCV
ncbi:putative dsRNA-binding PKR inhibitor [Parapoxvirus red deer/HL953]|uniref:Putative dsRNA-binding PKR inhibitor n=1 Tax=Parapoxvirus red deer/HL953 TaxID=1579460 RepID=A0A0A7MEQ3_9POXV|nr:putative dsRNA-binding PKR inhibitor [Parapoxvirus red deer/HL953]AIZ77271.1 putative dsRNA-binding PKR inhibitor [Parapoxvirus red deer/HL953]